VKRLPFLLWGLCVVIVGLAALLMTSVVALLAALAGRSSAFFTMASGAAWYSGLAVLLGAALIGYDLFVLLPSKRRRRQVPWDPPARQEVTAVLTAYNDAASIGAAVRDFTSHSRVRRVIVVDNASADDTAAEAAKAGATVLTETRRGYGHCVYRALQAGLECDDTELTLLCEGDCTFRAHDVDKFLAYIPHADVVNGTRIVEQLRSPETQLTTFMYYGNFFAGKLLEAKHLGWGTFTDVGTTYKLCRNAALKRLMPALNPAVNLEFNAHFLDTALRVGIAVVECPISFFPRVGTSKGGNIDNWRAFRVGVGMIRGLLFGWPEQQ
jgi:hypothetical protein